MFVWRRSFPDLTQHPIQRLQGPFPRGKNDQGKNLTTRLHLARMWVVILPLNGLHRDKFTLRRQSLHTLEVVYIMCRGNYI
jgi:hypothetical protein